MDVLIKLSEQDDLDLASNALEKTYPAGMTTEVLATRALRRIVDCTSDPQDREHVTRYIYANPRCEAVGTPT
jgi:spore coat polysaccharide biosynthesis protein SpsF